MAKQRSSGDDADDADGAPPPMRGFSRGSARRHAFGASTLGSPASRNRAARTGAQSRACPAGDLDEVHAVDRRAGAATRSRCSGSTGDEALSFQRAGVRIQVLRRLRRGLYPVEDELDLHGLSQTAAREQLARFHHAAAAMPAAAA